MTRKRSKPPRSHSLRHPGIESLEPRRLFDALPTTTTLTSSAPLLNYNQSVTFTASVTASGTPVPSGTVAFVEPLLTSTTSLYQSTGRFPNVLFHNPDTQAYQLLQLIGTAPLTPDGTASLSLSSLDLSTSAIQAIFLGSTPILSADSFSILSPDTFPGYASEVGIASGSTLAITSDNYLVINPNSSSGLYASFETAIPSFTTLVTPGPDGLYYQDLRDSFYMTALALPPSDTPYLLVDTPWTTQDYNYYWGNYTTTHHSLSITPFTGLPDLPGQNDDFETSLSSSLSIAPNQPTTLHISTSGPATYTNPPAITVSLSTPDGASYSHHAPNPTPRGTYNQAHAGLDVQVSTPSGGGGGPLGGVVSSGGGYHQLPFIPSGPFPTGTVSFFDENNTLLATLPLDSDGNATFYPDPRSLSLDSPHTIHAVYSGDSVYQPADASTSPFTLSHTPTSVYLADLPSTIYSDTTLHLKGVVSTSVADIITPTGTLTFSVDGQILTTLPALPGPPSTSDPASPSIPLTLSPGTHTLTLSYSGDANSLPSSYTYTITVLDQPTPQPTPNPPTTYPTYSTIPSFPSIPSIPQIPPIPPILSLPNSAGYVVDDATLTSATPSPTASPGGAILISATAEFTGTGKIPFPDHFFSFALSADDVAGNADDIPLTLTYSDLDTTDYLLINSLFFDSSGHATYSNSFSVTLPADIVPGAYHLVAAVDPNNVFSESDETNNTLVSAETVTIKDPANPAHPTLPVLITPDLTGSLAPARSTIPLNTPAKLTLSLTNPSASPIKRKLNVTYYLSDDSTFSSNDFQFSKKTITATLPKNQTRSYSLSYKLPRTAPLGTRYLIAVADTPAPILSSHLELSSPSPITILGPNLTSSILSTKSLPNHKTRLTLRLTNTGQAPSTTPITLRLSSSTSPTPLLQLTRPLSLPPGKSTTLTLTLPTPIPDPSTLSIDIL